MRWPIADHIITRDFHYLSSLYIGGQHAAADLVPSGRSATGEPVRAIADWEAVGIGWDYYSGFFIALDHAGGYRSFYRHLYGQSPIVVGQRGNQGDIIGNVGNTGWSLGAHLHFDLWNCIQFYDSTAFYKNGWWAHDPELYLGEKQEEEEMKARFVHARSGQGPQWVVWPFAKMGLPPDDAEQIKRDLVNLGLAEDIGSAEVAGEFLDWLIDYPKDIQNLGAMIGNIPGGQCTLKFPLHIVEP